MDRRKRSLIYAVIALCIGAAVFVADPGLSWTGADTSVGKCGYAPIAPDIRSRALAGIGIAVRPALPERRRNAAMGHGAGANTRRRPAPARIMGESSGKRPLLGVLCPTQQVK